MSWSEILGHDQVLQRFQRTMSNDRLASTYLFVGPRGIGKRKFALKLAETLLCEGETGTFAPCGICPACQQVQSESHPDLISVAKPADKSVLPLEAFIGSKEKRRQEGLCHDIGLKPFRGGRKVAIIDDADYFNQESANSLLKTLEEPPPRSVLIMIGTSAKRQLPTILSRSQVVRFQELSFSNIESILGRLQPETDTPLDQLALSANGSIDFALKLVDRDFMEFRNDFLRQLGQLEPGQGGFQEQTVTFLEGGGKDSAAKKIRMEFVTETAIQFLRHWMQPELPKDQTMKLACQTATEKFSNIVETDRPEPTIHLVAAECLSRTIDAQRHVQSNASPINVLNAWFGDTSHFLQADLRQVS